MENSSSHYNDCFDRVQAISLPSLILLLTFCFLVGVVTVFQNLLVLWVIYRNPSLRSNVGFGVSSLAVADLLVGLLGVPVWSIKLSHKAGYIEANVHNLFSCIFTLTLVSSSWSLVGLSYDRFVGVTSPLRYASRVTPTRFVRAIAVIWLLSCLIAIATLMRKCEVSARGHFLFIFGTFVFPFSIISYFYFRIFKEAQNQVKLIHVQEVGNATFRSVRRENKATMTVALVIGSSALCWLPSLIDAVIHVVAPAFWRETQLYLGATTLACCSSAINPVVYSIRNKPFRDSCFESISSLICWRRRSPTVNPSNNWKVKRIYSQKTRRCALSRPKSRPSLIVAGDWALGSRNWFSSSVSLVLLWLRGPGGYGDENGRCEVYCLYSSFSLVCRFLSDRFENEAEIFQNISSYTSSIWLKHRGSTKVFSTPQDRFTFKAVKLPIISLTWIR